MQFPLVAFALPFPCRYERESLVIAQRFSVGRLALDAEVAAARFFPLQSVEAHQLPEFQEVRNPARFFERLIEFLALPNDPQVVPEFLAQSRYSLEVGPQ